MGGRPVDRKGRKVPVYKKKGTEDLGSRWFGWGESSHPIIQVLDQKSRRMNQEGGEEQRKGEIIQKNERKPT